ncbi:hypothetical protein Tco_0885826 [Tanacetum coccineum]
MIAMDFLLVRYVEHGMRCQLCGKWTDGRERGFLASATSTGAGSYTENANAAMAGVWSRYCLRRSEPHLAVGAYFSEDSSSHCYTENAIAAMTGVWSRYCIRRSEPHLLTLYVPMLPHFGQLWRLEHIFQTIQVLIDIGLDIDMLLRRFLCASIGEALKPVGFKSYSSQSNSKHPRFVPADLVYAIVKELRLYSRRLVRFQRGFGFYCCLARGYAKKEHKDGGLACMPFCCEVAFSGGLFADVVFCMISGYYLKTKEPERCVLSYLEERGLWAKKEENYPHGAK